MEFSVIFVFFGAFELALGAGEVCDFDSATGLVGICVYWTGTFEVTMHGRVDGRANSKRALRLSCYQFYRKNST
jgi:hypothetical protein